MGLLKKATTGSASPAKASDFTSQVQASSPPASPVRLRQDTDPSNEMGKALCSRLLSLQPDRIRPETAISLLKAYGSFHAGVCFSLRKGSYSAYASVGVVNTAELTFPQEDLELVPGKRHYSIQHDFSGEFPPSLRLWAFPLTPAERGFPLAILAAAADKRDFHCETVEAVLSQTRAVFLPPPGFTAADTFAGNAKKPSPSGGEKAPKAGGLLNRIARKSILEKTIMESLDSEQGAFQGIIIEALQYSAGGFSGRIFSMVSGFGTAQPLTPGRCLVLFDSAKDGELIAHHLAKTVFGKSIFRFRAENPQEAFVLLKPYL